MNRKMRAKLANKQAKAAREKRACPRAGQFVWAPSIPAHCDACGDELVPVDVATLTEEHTQETLH